MGLTALSPHFAFKHFCRNVVRVLMQLNRCPGSIVPAVSSDSVVAIGFVTSRYISMAQHCPDQDVVPVLLCAASISHDDSTSCC